MSALDDLVGRARARPGDSHVLVFANEGERIRLSVEDIASGAELGWIRLDRERATVLRDQIDRFLGDRKPSQTAWARLRAWVRR